MRLRGIGSAVLALALAASSAGSAWASTINYDPSATPPAPVLNAGWAYDQINTANTDSVDSPYVYNLTNFVKFSITDAFNTGDQYKVYDFGVLILTTSTFAGAPFPVASDATADAAWASSSFQHGTVLLASGSHQLTVQGDGAGGLAAGFYTRMDAVPLPSASLMGLGLLAGLGGVAWVRRRRATTSL
jgi:hypothetical protein